MASNLWICTSDRKSSYRKRQHAIYGPPSVSQSRPHTIPVPTKRRSPCDIETSFPSFKPNPTRAIRRPSRPLVQPLGGRIAEHKVMASLDPDNQPTQVINGAKDFQSQAPGSRLGHSFNTRTQTPRPTPHAGTIARAEGVKGAKGIEAPSLYGRSLDCALEGGQVCERHAEF